MTKHRMPNEYYVYHRVIISSKGKQMQICKRYLNNSSGNNFRHCPGFQFLHVTSFLGNIGL